MKKSKRFCKHRQLLRWTMKIIIRESHSKRYWKCYAISPSMNITHSLQKHLDVLLVKQQQKTTKIKEISIKKE